MPALFSLYLNGRLNRFKVVGFARIDWSQDRFREQVRSMIADVPGGTDENRERFLQSLAYIQSTFENGAGYRRMHEESKGFSNRLN